MIRCFSFVSLIFFRLCLLASLWLYGFGFEYRARSRLSVSIMKQLFVTAGEVRQLIETRCARLKKPREIHFRLTSGTIKTKILIFFSSFYRIHSLSMFDNWHTLARLSFGQEGEWEYLMIPSATMSYDFLCVYTWNYSVRFASPSSKFPKSS